jgi:DNA polymerase-3 subunit alpha
MVEEKVRLVDQWFEQNHIDAKWETDKTFWVGEVRYLYLRPKEGEDGSNKIFSPDFSLLIDTDELEEFMTGDEHKVDYYCFEFGGKVYFSTVSGKPELNLFKHLGRAKDVSGFDYLGIHGGYELCSGSRTYDAWCEKAKFLGIGTLGICERHTLAGVLKFQSACLRNKIKPIIGETLYVKLETGVDYFVKIYVANQIGWTNLLKLHKILNIDNGGKFVRQADLIDYSEGLYCIFQHDTMLTDSNFAEFFHAKFLGTYFQFDPVQYKAEKRDLACLSCLKQALKMGVPLALICDSYYLDQEDNRVKQILQFVGNVGFEYQSDNQYFKSLEEVSLEALEMFTTKGDEFGFQTIESAMSGLDEISRGCDFNIELGRMKLPKYTLTEQEAKEFETPEDLFWSLVEAGLQKKVFSKGKDQEVYLKRIETEFDVISRGGFIDYFLILTDIVNWCKGQDILTGLGRGSAAGSLISYCLDLTKIDPIEYDLLFERFLNEGRVSKVIEQEVLVINDDIDIDLSRKISILRKGQKLTVLGKELQIGDELVDFE